MFLKPNRLSLVKDRKPTKLLRHDEIKVDYLGSKAFIALFREFALLKYENDVEFVAFCENDFL